MVWWSLRGISNSVADLMVWCIPPDFWLDSVLWDMRTILFWKKIVLRCLLFPAYEYRSWSHRTVPYLTHCPKCRIRLGFFRMNRICGICTSWAFVFLIISILLVDRDHGESLYDTCLAEKVFIVDACFRLFLKVFTEKMALDAVPKCHSGIRMPGSGMYRRARCQTLSCSEKVPSSSRPFVSAQVSWFARVVWMYPDNVGLNFCSQNLANRAIAKIFSWLQLFDPATVSILLQFRVFQRKLRLKSSLKQGSFSQTRPRRNSRACHRVDQQM
jgi:hypothetical protein